MNLLSNVITYVRRIIKSPSDSSISDDLIIDYINRFWIMDVDARIQLFDLKTKYQFQTVPGVDKYNMPLYNVQTEEANYTQEIGMYPVYQGFLGPAYVNGLNVPFYTEKTPFFNTFSNAIQPVNIVAVGNGGPTYSFQLPILSGINSVPNNPPINSLLRGHIDINGIVATGFNIDPPVTNSFITNIPSTSVDSAFFITSIDGNGASVVVQDSGQFLAGNVNYGLLMSPGKAPLGNTALPPGYSTTSNTVNYLTGQVNVTFPVIIPAGNNINVQCFFFQSGLPRGILYNNNTLTLRVPPATQYLVEIDAYLSPAAFMNSSAALTFGYMAEYIARGAARKILSDTGDVDQFMFYEPLFKEQEMLVWKRSQRQFTSTRTQTIYSKGRDGTGQNASNGGSTI